MRVEVGSATHVEVGSECVCESHMLKSEVSVCESVCVRQIRAEVPRCLCMCFCVSVRALYVCVCVCARSRQIRAEVPRCMCVCLCLFFCVCVCARARSRQIRADVPRCMCVGGWVRAVCVCVCVCVRCAWVRGRALASDSC